MSFSYTGEKNPKLGSVRLSALSKSFLPGWGQISLGYNGRGAGTIIYTGAAGIYAYRSWGKYEDSKNRADELYEMFQVSNNAPERQSLQEQAILAAAQADAYQENFYWSLAYTGYWYLTGFIESYFFATPPKRKVLSATSFSVGIPQMSGTRAAIRSLLVPGFGQKYYGSGFKSFFFRAGFMTFGLLTLDQKLKYDLNRVGYDFANAQFENAETIGDKNFWQYQAAAQYSGMENRKDRLYVYAGVTAGLWFLSVLDAAINGGKVHEQPLLEIGSEYRNQTVHSTVTMRF